MQSPSPRLITLLALLVVFSTGLVSAQDNFSTQVLPISAGSLLPSEIQAIVQGPRDLVEQPTSQKQSQVDAAQSDRTAERKSRFGSFPPIVLSLGWYCDAYDGFFDSNGDVQDFNGRERMAMYLLGGTYQFADFDLGGNPATAKASAKFAFASQHFKSDDGDFDDGTTGIQNIILGVGARTQLGEAASINARLNAFLDVADEDNSEGFQLSNGSNALSFQLGFGYQMEKLRLGATYYHVNQTESNYRNTNALGLRGSIPVVQTPKIEVSGGLRATYLMESDDGGNLLGAGLFAKLDVVNSPLSFKLDGGCTEELVPFGNIGIKGERWLQPKSFSARAMWNLGQRDAD